MKNLKPYFWYSKSQRNGVFALLLLIVLLQVVIVLLDELKFKTPLKVDEKELAIFQKQIDSLKELALIKKERKIFPFNPNYISDYKGEQLGMSLDEIDRLHHYRDKGKFVNSVKEFQYITKVSDSLLAIISPYFKFPDWVIERERMKASQKRNLNVVLSPKLSPKKELTLDLNIATVSDLLHAEGVSYELAERVVKYRNKLKGFTFKSQIQEVYGISSTEVYSLLQTFPELSKPTIKKINLNTASFKEVLSLPYIDYDLCIKLFDFKDEVAELQSIEEIKSIENFPVENYSRIILYLFAE